MDIGKKLKALRNEKGLTQEELADRCELTKGFISQMERDQASPSINTLIDILQCLGTNPSEFFSETRTSQVVFKKEDFFEKVDEELGTSIEWIVPDAQKNQMEPILLHLEAGGKTAMDTPHEGEEFGFVLEGRITVCIGANRYSAKKGESFYYSAKSAHGIEAAGKRGATVLWVSTPPMF